MTHHSFIRILDRHEAIHVIQVAQIVSISQNISRSFYYICFTDKQVIEITDETMRLIYDYLQVCHEVTYIHPQNRS